MAKMPFDPLKKRPTTLDGNPVWRFNFSQQQGQRVQIL
jgi:hypothetical protein